jgi:dsDNA-binding SOS-regulon protein
VRFSVWDDGVARAAVSLDDEEARRLALFIAKSRS